MLVLLLDRGPLDQGALARATRRSASTISRTVVRLERRGPVERVRLESDLRRRVVALTPEGAVVIERVLRARAALIAARLAGASADERAQVALGASPLASLLGDAP